MLKFVNLKVCTVAAFSCVATVGVQHWCTSKSSDNVPPPMREEQTQLKQLKLETEKVLDELRARQAKVEKDEKAFAEKQSALDEKIAAFEQMRTSGATTVVAKEPDGVVAIEPIGKDPKPAIVKVIHSDPVVPPTDYVPRRPQVFDGGNREPVVPKASVTNEPRLLYFHDPSFATDGSRHVPAIPRRGDALWHPVNIFKRRRFVDLKPQHVASFRATKDGWSLETQDGVSNGAYAPATRIEQVIDSTAAGASYGIEKSDATVVTWHGSGDPKPPFDGKSAVSEAERNAFNKERRNFEEQQKAFELEKSKKEKELAEKTKELKDRETFLELREENKDDAADLFDLSERQTIQYAENFNIPRREKEPYIINRQNKKGMTIERQPKPELVSETRDSVGIDAQEKKSYKKQLITSINLCDKEREKTQIGSTNSIKLAHEEPKKEISNAESIQILKKKEKAQLIPIKSEGVEVKATKKQPPKFEISKTQQITAEAQAVKTKESATEPQKPELSIALNTAEVSFKKNTLPKKEFTIDGQSELLLRRKKTEKTEANVGTEPPQLEISETKTLTAEAKKVEKQEIGTGMEAPTPSVITKGVSFEYQTKNQPKSLSVHNESMVAFEGRKSFGELQGDVVEKSMHIPAKPKPMLKIGKQRETLLFEAQPKPESEISSVEMFDILRREKPKNQISSEVSVKVLPKPKQAYVKTNGDLLFIEGNDANWYLKSKLNEIETALEQEKEASGLLKTELDLAKTLQQAERVMKLDALKPTKAVSESVIRTKNTRNTKVQTADKVPLFMEKNELFIKGEKPSEDWIIDFDEGESFVSEEAASEKINELFQSEYPKLSKSVSLLKESVKFGESNADAIETLSELRKKQQMLLKKMDDFEKTFHKPYFQTHHRFVCELGEELDAVEAILQKQKPLLNEPKAAEMDKMFKPGWSVLAEHRTMSHTFKWKVQPKSFSELLLRRTNGICFIGKSPFMIDSEVQADEPRRFLGNLQSENVMKESFVDDKLSLVSRLEQKKQKHKKLKSDYLDLQKNVRDMLDINDEYRNENEKIKIINRERNQEIEELKKQYNALWKAFEEFKNFVGTGCEYFEFESEKVLNEAKAIVLEAMEGITDGTLRGEKAEKLLKRYGETAGRWSSVSHKCDNSVCHQRQRFMDSLAFLLRKMARIPEADAFKPIQTDQWTLKGGIPKVSKPFEIISADSFGLDVNPEVKSKKEAQKEQLSRLTAENEELKSRLQEVLVMQEELLSIIEKTKDGEEPLEKENNDLKEKLEELEKQNKEKDEKLKKLEKQDEETSELFSTACSDNDELRKELEEKDKQINDQKWKYRMLQEEMEKIRQEKDNEINAQKRENRDLGDENFLLEFENKVLKDRPKNEGDEKKNSKDKKFKKLPKKPTDPGIAKEVNVFLENLKKAGDNLKKLELLRKELETKPRLKEWVSDELKEAIKDAKEHEEREEKYKKEEEEAKKETNELKQKLKDAKNVKQLKQVIMAFLDNAERRLNIAAKEFEDMESFVKGIEDAYGSDSEQARTIAQKNASGSFVHTVSALQKNVIEAWKKITVILKPKALPGKVLEEVTADEEEKKINREAERRKRAVVQEKDAEIAALKKKLEEMERKLKKQVLDAKTRRHIKGKTETNLLHETNVSPLYKFNDTSDVRDKKKRDDDRRSTQYETPGTSKLRNRCANNYSRDDSRRSSASHSQTLLKEFENSGSRLENYNESQIKSDKTFETLDTKGLQSFTAQGKSANFLGSIEEMKDEIQEDDKEYMLPKLRKAGQQVLNYLNSDYWKNDVMWDRNFETQNKSVEEALRSLLEYIEKKNKRTPVLQKSVTEKKLKTTKAGTKTRSRFLLPTTVTDISTENKSGLTKNLKSMFDNQKSDGKGKDTGTHYKKIDPKNLSGKRKLNYK